MDEDKIDCEGCPRKYDRVTGILKCGIKQTYWNHVRMCLTQHPKVGLYWLHHNGKNESFFKEEK